MISFDLPRAGKVTLSVYDITGRKARDLVSQKLPSGTHTAVWDGRDDVGRMVSSGVYLPCLMVDGFAVTGRMVLLK
jgi:flagellar hook assembly protein FlgD